MQLGGRRFDVVAVGLHLCCLSYGELVHVHKYMFACMEKRHTLGFEISRNGEHRVLDLMATVGQPPSPAETVGAKHLEAGAGDGFDVCELRLVGRC